MMGINQFSRNKDASWEFIKWITGKEIHKKFVLAGGPAARVSELNDADLRTKFPWFPTVGQSAEMAYPDCRPRIPESFQVIDTVGNYVSEALSGQRPIEDALGKANDDVHTLLKRGGYKVA
jgi:multiple sugar transport system substrate-binding protein